MNGLKKTTLTVMAILGIALQQAIGQNFMDGISYRAAMTPYSQPNIPVVENRKPLDYHGSGSLNGIEILRSDADIARSGEYHYQLDVNGDKTVNFEDADLIESYLSGDIPLLPSHWNHLSGKEKRAWATKYIYQSKVYSYGQERDWSCGIFAIQTCFNTFGIEHSELVSPENDHDWSENGRWNIPVYVAFTHVTLGIVPDITTNNNGHFINAILVGPDTDERYMENPLKFSHWLFFEPQLNKIVQPGDFQMAEDSPVIIEEWVYSPYAANTFTWARVVEFDLSQGRDATNYSKTQLVLTNPNRPVVDTVSPVLPDLPNFTFEYEKGKDYSPEAVYKPVAIDNIDENPVESYEDSSTEEDSGYGKYNYIITRTWTATDASGNVSEKKSHTITVQDTEAPIITGLQNLEFEYSENLDLSPEVTGAPTANDNGEVESFIPTDNSTRVMDGTIKQVNYVITRTWTATDFTKNTSDGIETRTVSDKTNPEMVLAPNVKLDLNADSEAEIAKTIVSTSDNSNLPTKNEVSSYTINYDGGKVITVNVIATDIAGNKTIGSRTITLGNPIIPDSSKPYLLKIYREGENLQIKYFADGTEDVEIQVINMSNGTYIKTTTAKVVPGNNLLIVPCQQLNSLNIIRVIDKNTSNVQTKAFVDFK